jgi:hypothetical protein
MKKKVSFDFDDTLSYEVIQDYAKSLIKQGIEVHIVTSRYEDCSMYNFDCNHDDLFKVAKELGLDKDHIHFTNFMDKWNFFDIYEGFVWHLDDNPDEVIPINNLTKTIGIEVFTYAWLDRCNELLELPNETI